jgi:hypothetical protein
MEIYIVKSGKETGPFTKEQITPMLDSGMVALTDLLWHEGLAGWIPVHQFLGVRPPLPISPPEIQENRLLHKSQKMAQPIRFWNVVTAVTLMATVTAAPAFIVSWLWQDDFRVRYSMHHEQAVVVLLCVFFFLLWTPLITGAWIIGKACRAPLPIIGRKNWFVVPVLAVLFLIGYSYYLCAPAMAPYRSFVMTGRPR